MSRQCNKFCSCPSPFGNRLSFFGRLNGNFHQNCRFERIRCLHPKSTEGNNYFKQCHIDKNNSSQLPVNTGTPFSSSVLLMAGTLMQLAAATAANGTKRPTMGGRFFTRRLSPSAVVHAPVVAAMYDPARRCVEMGVSPLLFV